MGARLVKKRYRCRAILLIGQGTFTLKGHFMDQTVVTEQMRLGLRRFAKAVMVVSARHDGVRYAMSVTACSEVSLNPPTMLVCVNQATSMHIPLAAGADFAINMLHSGQEQISRNCSGAKRGEERFSEGDWQEDDGTPFLADGQASFICSVVNRADHGTHSVFIGEVRAAYTAEIVDPLVYVDGRYLEPAHALDAEDSLDAEDRID